MVSYNEITLVCSGINHPISYNQFLNIKSYTIPFTISKYVVVGKFRFVKLDKSQ